jgi:hypothetical protein
MSETELKKDVETDVQTESAKLHADAVKVEGTIKTHIAWAIGAICLIVGFIAGRFV